MSRRNQTILWIILALPIVLACLPFFVIELIFDGLAYLLKMPIIFLVKLSKSLKYVRHKIGRALKFFVRPIMIKYCYDAEKRFLTKQHEEKYKDLIESVKRKRGNSRVVNKDG